MFVHINQDVRVSLRQREGELQLVTYAWRKARQSWNEMAASLHEHSPARLFWDYLVIIRRQYEKIATFVEGRVKVWGSLDKTAKMFMSTLAWNLREEQFRRTQALHDVYAACF
jgi:hypothetical protein